MSTVTDSTVHDAYKLYGNTSSSTKSDTTASADRFLTMLVTQLQNQDPLNPMENAELTSQMAQINTVTQLDKVNESVQSLGSQLLQLQALQGANLIGRDVKIDGDQLTVNDGVGKGALVLAGPATTVKVEVLDAKKNVVGTLALGALKAGLHDFEWPLGTQPADGKYSFRVTAANSGTAVESATLMVDRVNAVSNAGSTLTLTLARNGSVPASEVVTYN